MKNKIDVFISHAVADAPIAKEFVKLIESGIGVPPSNIFCTSIKGQSIKPGAEFKESIRESLDDASTVIALITENYYHSPFCMCELGGTWLQAKNFIPIIIPPIKFSDLKAVLVGLQALKINLAEDLDELRDELNEQLDINLLPTPRWNEKSKEFLKGLPKILKKLPKPKIVSIDKYEKLDSVVEEYKVSLQDAEQKVEKLSKTVKKLKKLKDAKEVTKIVRDDLEDTDVFEELVADASAKIGSLHDITAKAIFSEQKCEDYILGREYSEHTWDEAASPIDYKEIKLNSDENGVIPNPQNPKTRIALDAISELNKWLTETASAEFFELYTSENDGHVPELDDRNFWDTHLW